MKNNIPKDSEAILSDTSDGINTLAGLQTPCLIPTSQQLTNTDSLSYNDRFIPARHTKGLASLSFGQEVKGIEIHQGLSAESPILDIYNNNWDKLKLKSVKVAKDFDCAKAYKNFYFQNEKGERIPFKCGHWNCETCFHNKKWALKFLIEDIAQYHQTKYFITLTMGQIVDLDIANPYFSDVFAKFRKKFKRHFGEDFKFIRITESHKSGYPHFHILTHQYIPVKWLREAWVSCGGGKIMKSIELKPQGKEQNVCSAIGKYLSSYFSKSKIELPKGFRHWTTNYKVPEREHPSPLSEHTWNLMVDWTLKTGEIITETATQDSFGYANIIYDQQLLRQKILNTAIQQSKHLNIS
jgi:hypothetical protein